MNEHCLDRRQFAGSIPALALLISSQMCKPEDSGIPDLRKHKRIGYTPGSDPEAELPAFDWDKSGPLDLITHLQSLAKAGTMSLTVKSLHLRWVVESDVHHLMQRIDDNSSAAEILPAISSRLPTQHSTVSKEVIKLIFGYWTGIFPYDSPSMRLDPDTVIKWYSVWRLAS